MEQIRIRASLLRCRKWEQIRIRASLYRLRKNSGFDFALKGCGFSRAVSLAKSKAALAADAPSSYQDDFFRSRFSDAENGSRFVSGHRFSDAVNAAFTNAPSGAAARDSSFTAGR
jgi:hypothetical protein